MKCVKITHSPNLRTRSGAERQYQSLLTGPSACPGHPHAPVKGFHSVWPFSIQPEKKSAYYYHILTTWPQTWLCASVMLDRLVGGALQQTPGHNHTLTTMGLLSKWKLLLRLPKQITISTRSRWQWRSYFNESSSSPGGWDHAAGNRKMISTRLSYRRVLWWREAEGEEDEEGGKLGRVQSTMHQPAGLTLQSSALPSASFFSCFSLYRVFSS